MYDVACVLAMHGHKTLPVHVALVTYIGPDLHTMRKRSMLLYASQAKT